MAAVGTAVTCLKTGKPANTLPAIFASHSTHTQHAAPYTWHTEKEGCVVHGSSCCCSCCCIWWLWRESKQISLMMVPFCSWGFTCQQGQQQAVGGILFRCALLESPALLLHLAALAFLPCLYPYTDRLISLFDVAVICVLQQLYYDCCRSMLPSYAYTTAVVLRLL